MKKLASPRRAWGRAKGAALVEFALVALLFLITVFVSFNFFFWTFSKAVLHNAVREGARYAITGQTSGTLGQDAAIRQVVRDNAFGLLSATDTITVVYSAADGTPGPASNAAGNIVTVSILNYTPAMISLAFGFTPPVMTIRAVDKVEPFGFAPATR